MEENEMVDLLFGSQTYKKNCAGYCHRKGKYMTVKIINTKGCLGKQCKYLEKLPHRSWLIRENHIAKKKAAKAAVKGV